MSFWAGEQFLAGGVKVHRFVVQLVRLIWNAGKVLGIKSAVFDAVRHGVCCYFRVCLCNSREGGSARFAADSCRHPG